MTQFDDGLALGAAPPPPTGQQKGLPISGEAMYTVVPTTVSVNNLASSQAVSGANFTLRTGSGITTEVINGTTYYVLDVPRVVTASGNDVSSVGTDITVNGLDVYKKAMTATFSGPSGTAASQTTKAFKYISTVASAGNTLTGVSLGTGDKLGMPYYVGDKGYAQMAWDGALITTSAALLVGDTTTATALTGDTRGTVSLPTASNGTKRLVVRIFVNNPNTQAGVYGVTQA